MTWIELAPAVLEDFDRFLDHMAQYDVADQVSRIDEIVQSIDILTHSPLIGGPVKGGRRELVTGRGDRGYVALYHYVSAIDTVYVLAIRSQREVGFRRGN